MSMTASQQEQTGTARAATALVSVVIPTYNRADLIGETIDSVLAQGYPNIEIVVIDDGSTDGTEALVKQYGERLRYVRKPNGGLASARNRAQREARGEYVAWLDSDDLCDPDRIALQVAYLEANPDVQLCSSDFGAFSNEGTIASSYIGEYYGRFRRSAAGIRGVYPEGGTLAANDIPWIKSGEIRQIPTYRGELYRDLVWGNFIHPPTVMVRRRAAERVGEFDESLTFACDHEWLIRASRLGPIGYIHYPLLRYRLSESQMSGDRNTARIKLESIRVMQTVCASDQAYCRARRGDFRRRIADAHLGAADALAETVILPALAQLARSVAYGGIGVETFKTLVKILLPGVVLRMLRRLRGLGDGSAKTERA
jgi:glycosyltransferase involved in cell wall biosynthesis